MKHHSDGIHTAWANLRAFVVWILLVFPSMLFGAIPGEEDRLPQPCATDPVYQEFEKIQIDAYQSDVDLQFRRFLSADWQDTLKRNVVRDLRRRAGDQSGVVNVPPGFDQTVEFEMAHLEIPTCYESRPFYFMIDKYARDLETARRELGLPLSTRPRFGSLPSNDINAYTYRLRNGEVIAINSQLLTFVSAMGAVARTVDPKLDGREHSEADVITQGILAIAYDTQAKENFVASVVGLLLGKPVMGAPVTRQEEPLVVFLDGAMERFAVAHEYGHLIKNHLSSTTNAPASVTGSHEYEVCARTWSEEFEADTVGLELLTHILLRAADENPHETVYFIYALKAPLFFFDCMDLLDRAKFMLENGRMPPELTENDKSMLRRCTEGPVPLDSEACRSAMHETHPPAWLRRERLAAAIRNVFAELPNTKTTRAAVQAGDEALFSLGLFWRETSKEILRRFADERQQ